MQCPVIQLEIGCRDVVRADEFFSSVFGWIVEPPQGTTARIVTSSKAGFSGALIALGHEPYHYMNIYMEVEDINHSVAEVKRHGGQSLLDPFPFPGNLRSRTLRGSVTPPATRRDCFR